MSQPTNCDNCQASLERGNTSVYRGDKLIKSICFECDDKEIFTNYLKDKKLITRLLSKNMMALYDFNMRDALHDKNGALLEELKHRVDIQLSSTKIQLKIKEFEKKVWFNGLQATVKASDTKGVSAKLKIFDNFCVLTYSMCGRTMITIEDDNNSVTAITSEDGSESCMGLQGIRATEKEALSLITLAIEFYNSKGRNPLVFKEDKRVSMGF